MDMNRIVVLKDESPCFFENSFSENIEPEHTCYTHKDVAYNYSTESNNPSIINGSSKTPSNRLKYPINNAVSTSINGCNYNDEISCHSYQNLPKTTNKKSNVNHKNPTTNNNTNNAKSMPQKRIERHHTQCTVRSLNLISLVFGLAATGSLSLAASTDFWLHTNEPFKASSNDTMPSDYHNSNNSDNSSPEYYDYVDEVTTSNDYEASTMLIQTHSGLWRICIVYENPGEEVPPEMCFTIAYIDQSWERPETTETTFAILRAIRMSAPFVVVSLLLLFISLALSIIGQNKSDLKTIVGALVYILSGLILAMGVILYISSVNDEVSHRKKTETDSKHAFTYSYGWAFFFGAASFLCSMVAAVSNISIYTRNFNNRPPTTCNVLTSHKTPLLALPKADEGQAQWQCEEVPREPSYSTQPPSTQPRMPLKPLYSRSQLSLPPQQQPQMYKHNIERHPSLQRPPKVNEKKIKKYDVISKQDVRHVFSSFIL